VRPPLWFPGGRGCVAGRWSLAPPQDVARGAWRVLTSTDCGCGESPRSCVCVRRNCHSFRSAPGRRSGPRGRYLRFGGGGLGAPGCLWLWLCAPGRRSGPRGRCLCRGGGGRLWLWRGEDEGGRGGGRGRVGDACAAGEGGSDLPAGWWRVRVCTSPAALDGRRGGGWGSFLCAAYAPRGARPSRRRCQWLGGGRLRQGRRWLPRGRCLWPPPPSAAGAVGASPALFSRVDVDAWLAVGRSLHREMWRGVHGVP
jgi:hypothetical protein